MTFLQTFASHSMVFVEEQLHKLTLSAPKELAGTASCSTGVGARRTLAVPEEADVGASVKLFGERITAVHSVKSARTAIGARLTPGGHRHSPVTLKGTNR